MSKDISAQHLKRVAFPLAVFAAVFGAHYLWLGFFPEGGSARSRWALPADMPAKDWWSAYVEEQSYFIGFSYAISLAFAAWALQRYRAEKLRGARVLAVGGFTFSGMMAIAGCYLLGCCGSPMLVVYLNLFGAGFLPLAKPFIAALTLVSVAAAAWWLERNSRRKACCSPEPPH